MRGLLSLICVALALPVLGVLGAWLALDAAALATLSHQASTVLSGYVLQTTLLAAGVGLGVMLLGTACATAVTLFEFPGRRIFEWALLAAAGHAGLCAGLCLDRRAAVQQPVADDAAPLAGGAGAAVARRAQPVGRGDPVRALPVPLCVPADARRAGRARRADDGGGATAGRGLGPACAAGGAATGPPGHRRRRGAGADGNPGRLRCRRLFRPEHLQHRHLQGLAGDERPHRRGATGLAAAAGGGPAAGRRAPRPAPAALCRRPQHAKQRGPRGAAARQGGVGGMDALRAAGVPGLRAAGGLADAHAVGRGGGIRHRLAAGAFRDRGRWPACSLPAWPRSPPRCWHWA